MMKDELPCYWLVGVVAYIDYNERFVGEIQHFTNLEDAKEEYSKQCDILPCSRERGVQCLISR
jgi:hypothetical protein